MKRFFFEVHLVISRSFHCVVDVDVAVTVAVAVAVAVAVTIFLLWCR